MQPDTVQRQNKRFECRFILLGARIINGAIKERGVDILHFDWTTELS